MGNFVSKHNGKGSLILCNRENALIHHDFSAWHAESIHLIVLHQIELPLVVRHLVGEAVVAQIGLHSGCQTLPTTFHHGCVGGIGGEFCRLHVVLILLITETHHFLVANNESLLTSRDRNLRGGSTTGKNGSKHHQHDVVNLFHNLSLTFISVAKVEKKNERMKK